MHLNQGNGRAPSGARSDSHVSLAGGESLPFTEHETSLAGLEADKRKPSPRTPREDDVDWDGPKTHRVICLARSAHISGPMRQNVIPAKGDIPAKVELVRTTRKIRLGDEVWVTADEARLLHDNRLCKTIEVRDGRGGEADPRGEEADPAGDAGEGRRVATAARARRRG